MILHALRVIHSKLRTLARPSPVVQAQHNHVKMFPHCAACSGTDHCQGHHIQPYHKFPELAAKPINFITLCMGVLECHLKIGHGGNFHYYNPHVVEDAEAFKIANETTRQQIVKQAQTARLPDA